MHTVSLKIPPHMEIAEKAIKAIEFMLENAFVKAEPGGGMTWEIMLDGHVYGVTVDREGEVRSTVSCEQD